MAEVQLFVKLRALLPVALYADVTLGEDDRVTVDLEGITLSSSTVCPPGSSTWMGIPVCDEGPRRGYDRSAFETGYSSLEDEIINSLPIMRAVLRARAPTLSPA